MASLGMRRGHGRVVLGLRRRRLRDRRARRLLCRHGNLRCGIAWGRRLLRFVLDVDAECGRDPGQATVVTLPDRTHLPRATTSVNLDAEHGGFGAQPGDRKGQGLPTRDRRPDRDSQRVDPAERGGPPPVQTGRHDDPVDIGGNTVRVHIYHVARTATVPVCHTRPRRLVEEHEVGVGAHPAIGSQEQCGDIDRRRRSNRDYESVGGHRAVLARPELAHPKPPRPPSGQANTLQFTALSLPCTSPSTPPGR